MIDFIDQQSQDEKSKTPQVSQVGQVGQSVQQIQPSSQVQSAQPTQYIQQPSQIPQQPGQAAGGVRRVGVGPITQPARGSGFMGIKRIIGASQGSRVGQAVTERLQSAGELARAGVAGARQQFETQAREQAQKMQQQAELSRGALTNILGTGQPGVPTAEQQAAFQAAAAGQYMGPMGLQDAEDLRTKTVQAQMLGQLAGTQTGREQLLKQQYAQRGGYGARQSALDALIMGKTSARELAQARSGLGGIGRELISTEAGAAEQAKALKQQAAGLSKETLGALEAGATGIQKQVEAKTKELSEQQQKEYEALTKALQTGEVEEGDVRTLELLGKAGIREGSFLGGLSEGDIAQYVSRAGGPTAATVATPEQYARLKALEQLGGGLAAGRLAPTMAAYSGVTAEKPVGTYKPEEAVGFAKTKEGTTQTDLQSVLADRKSTAQQKLVQTKQIEDTNRAITDLISKYKDNADNMSFGERNFLAQHGIYALEGTRGNRVDWTIGTPSNAAGEWEGGGAEAKHPNELISKHSQIASEAGEQRKNFETTLGKTLRKVPPKASIEKLTTTSPTVRPKSTE